MRNLVPHFIQEKYLRDDYHGDFSAIGLFLDISGFSSITETLMEHGPHGAEVLASVMRRVFDPLARNVYAQGGFIATLAGDAFTALFPYVKDEAEASRRALAAAWGAQQTMAGKIEQHTPYGSFTIKAKVGLAVGSVRWGVVTSQDGRRAAYYFQGTAVDGCANAEHLAQAGEIILDSAIARQVAGGVQLEPVEGYHRLKQVIGSLPQPRPFQLPPPESGVIARFFPEVMLEQTFSGEFRQVVNLFISLPTVRTESQLAIFMNSLFELQDRYGGLLKTLDFGDKGSNVLLFWGAPVAYENDIERALDFILALQPLTSIPINAGVTYHISHAGFIGSPLLEEYTCFGRGVNLAARFMVAAPRGEIWVDAHIARRARAAYLLEPVGEMAFKGFAEKQMVFTLLERRQEAESLYTGELVGRESELESLTAFVEPLWQGLYAGALVIAGEPGIGKSRLAYTFQRASVFETQRALWALCQADATLRESLNPFTYWLRRYFAQSEALTEIRNKRSFNLKIDDLIEETAQKNRPLAEELDRVRSCLGALVGLHWSDSLYELLDPQGRYENTLIALTTLLSAESLRRPLMLFLEDVQWLDEDTRAYLPRLARALTSDERLSYPIAILATSRLEEPSDLLGKGLDYQLITLAGLTGGGFARLADQFLEGAPSQQLLKLLESRTEGNPFFAEQVLRYLKDEGLLERGEEGWRVAKTGDREPLPIDVRAVLAARLDRLGQEVKDVIQTASILGREFEVLLLARMLKDDANLHHKIGLATRASIWTALNEMRYLFKHALVHDAAYRMLVHTHRQSLHTQAVEALESVYSPDLRPHFGELAFHSEKAGLADKAIYYLRLAGDAARDAYQNNPAVDFYSRALKLMPMQDLEGRYTLLLSREAVYNLLGDREAQLTDLTALEMLAAALDAQVKGARQAEVGERWAGYANQVGDYEGAAGRAEKAVALARDAGDMEVTLRAHLTWSFALWRIGKYESAIQQAEAGLESARQIDNKREQSRALNTLGLIAMEQRGSIDARQYFEAALHIAQEAGDRQIEAAALNNLGNFAGASGDFIEAADYYQRAIQVTREIGQRPGEGRGLGNLGWIVGTLGDYTAARSYCEQNLRIAREAGDRHTEAYALVNLSAFSASQGEHATAQAYAERSLSLARETHDPSCEAWALTYLGNALLASGHVRASRGVYEGALNIRRSLGQPNLAAEPLAGLARSLLANGDLPTALRHVQEILTHLEGGGSLDGTDEPLRVYLTIYTVFHTASDPRAQHVLEEAFHILEGRAAKIKDATLRRTFIENVPYHREILAAWKATLD